mgnify:FL=1
MDSLKSFELFDPTQIKEFLRDRYDRIRNGAFAEEWEKEQKENDLATLKELSQKAMESELTKAEERLFEKIN